MDLDNEELIMTRNDRNAKSIINKEKIQEIIRNRILEIDSEEWDIDNSEDIKFYCKEELEKIMFKLIR